MPPIALGRQALANRALSNRRDYWVHHDLFLGALLANTLLSMDRHRQPLLYLLVESLRILDHVFQRALHYEFVSSRQAALLSLGLHGQLVHHQLDFSLGVFNILFFFLFRAGSIVGRGHVIDIVGFVVARDGSTELALSSKGDV